MALIERCRRDPMIIRTLARCVFYTLTAAALMTVLSLN